MKKQWLENLKKFWKQKNITYFVILIIILLMALFYYLFFYHSFSFQIKEQTNCEKKAQLYYTFEDKKIYTYCLEGIKIFVNNDELELKDYFKQTSSIDFLFKSKQIGQYKDGGSVLYRSRDNKLSILKCHALTAENLIEDIYIGPSWMQYETNFCE